MTIEQIRREREMVVVEAHSWESTPFHHGARVQGAGVDCAQLLVAVYAGLGLIDEPTIPFYPPNWFLHSDDNRLEDMVRQYCVRVDAPAVGDIALFRFGRAASHGGIVVAVEPELAMIHSYVQRGVVRESIGPQSPAAARLAGYWTLQRWSAA